MKENGRSRWTAGPGWGEDLAAEFERATSIQDAVVGLSLGRVEADVRLLASLMATTAGLDLWSCFLRAGLILVCNMAFNSAICARMVSISVAYA